MYILIWLLILLWLIQGSLPSTVGSTASYWACFAGTSGVCFLWASYVIILPYNLPCNGMGGGGYVPYNLPCNGMGGGGMSLSFHTTCLLAIIFCISIYTRHNSCCINILDIIGYTNKGSGQSVRKNKVHIWWLERWDQQGTCWIPAWPVDRGKGDSLLNAYVTCW